jgi:hypothetical protein
MSGTDLFAAFGRISILQCERPYLKFYGSDSPAWKPQTGRKQKETQLQYTFGDPAGSHKRL